MSRTPAFITFCCWSTASSNEYPLVMLRAWDGLRPAASNSEADARKIAWGDFSFPSSFRVPRVPRPGTILRASQKSVSSALDTLLDTWNRCGPETVVLTAAVRGREGMPDETPRMYHLI